jgi:hypothetical protein
MIHPPIPTDNLYKFVAISGLVICISSYWFPRQLDDSITPRIIQAKAELEDLTDRLREQAAIPPDVARFGLIRFDASTLEEDRGLFDAMIDVIDVLLELPANGVSKEKMREILQGRKAIRDYAKEPLVVQKSSNEKIIIHNENELLEFMMDVQKEFGKDYKESRRRLHAAKRTVDLLWFLLERKREYNFLSKAGVPLGLIMSVAGFGLWYRRVQRYQDRALVAESSASAPKPA